MEKECRGNIENISIDDKMTRKILILSNSFGGLYSFRKEVFQAYRDKGYEVYISSPIGNDGQKMEWFKRLGCNIIDTKFNRQGTNPIADFRLMLTYRKLIKKISPDIVLSYTIKPNLYGGMVCALCGIPQLANITGLGAAVEYPGIMQKITILLYKLGLRKTSMVFFQNEENRQFCLNYGMIKGFTRLIPGSGVNLSYHTLVNYPAEMEPIRFIFISRIRKEKGIEEYLAAAETIKQKYPKTEFHVLGGCEGRYEQRLTKLNDEKIIIYHGQQPDVRPYIANVHCTIHPTFYPEGMSNVLLESCAAGRAIITTDRAGCREIVDDGVNGFIVRQQDSNDLINKIEKFLKLTYNEKKQMGLAARKKVEKDFDRQIVVNAYLEETYRIMNK
ncbi:MAG: glycosyltransferase family 4 protein [Parabacteroides sp.]|nr:glycosyltransferase family 4 protein [Parabacteroides sp.]